MAFYSDFVGHYEKIFPFRKGVLEFLDAHLPSGGRVLDIGCGTGRYCSALDETGRRTLGIDLDPGMIGEAEKLNPGGEFRIMGMDEIKLLPGSSFRGVYCIGNVLPHLPAAGLKDFLGEVTRLLEPGGIWIFQTVNFDRLLDLAVFEFPDMVLKRDRLIFARSYRGIQTDRLEFHTRLTGPRGNIFNGVVNLHPRTSVDYATIHRDAGFVRRGHFADYQGRGFDPAESPGSVFVWEKPVAD
jgi:SAM-dependent methyltransferase